MTGHYWCHRNIRLMALLVMLVAMYVGMSIASPAEYRLKIDATVRIDEVPTVPQKDMRPKP